jgi:hypothetical protein
VKRYGEDAMLEASMRADQLLEEGDMAGAETWHRILNAIEKLARSSELEDRRKCVPCSAHPAPLPVNHRVGHL